MPYPLFPAFTSDLYPQSLSSVYLNRFRVVDPDFALISDMEILEKIERDTVIADAMQMRRHLVAGRDFNVNPGGSRPEDKMFAQLCEDLLQKVPRFQEARFQLTKAVFRGSAFLRIYGERRNLALAEGPALSWWMPTTLRDIDKRRVRRVVNHLKAGVVELEVWSVMERRWLPLEHPEWLVKHIYNDDEGTLGYGRGLLQALYYYYRSKALVLAEGLSAVDRWAGGMIHAAMDTLAEGEEGDKAAAAMIDRLRRMRSGNILITDKRDDLKVIEGSSQGWQIITEMLNYLDQAMRTLILGANLPTSATDGGSFALAKVQENSSEALIQYDRGLLAETLSRDLLGLVIDLNWANFVHLGLEGAARPYITVLQEKKNDPQVNAAVIAQALSAGIPLRKDEVYDRIGMTMPGPEDAVFEPRPAGAPGPFPLPAPFAPAGAPTPIPGGTR